MLVSSFSLSVARPTSPRMRIPPRVLQSPASCEAAPEGVRCFGHRPVRLQEMSMRENIMPSHSQLRRGVPGPVTSPLAIPLACGRGTATSPLATPLACGRGTATSPLATPLACGRGRGIDPFAPSLWRSDGRLPLHIPPAPGLPIPCPVTALVGAPIGRHGRRKRGPAGETQLKCSRQRLAVGCSTWKKRFKIPEGGGWRPLRKRPEIPRGGWLKP